MLKLAVLVSGGGTNLQAILDALADGRITNAQMTVVISNNRNAYALTRAEKAGVLSQCICPKDYENREMYYNALLNALEASGAELIVLAGCMVVMPEKIVRRYENRIINIHPALIPSFCGKDYYGLRVHEGVLERGVKVTGATVHFVDCGTDTGPIILQKAVEVLPEDTPKTLQRRVMEEAEWVIMPKAIDLIANGKIQVKDGMVVETKVPESPQMEDKS